MMEKFFLRAKRAGLGKDFGERSELFWRKFLVSVETLFGERFWRAKRASSEKVLTEQSELT